MAQQETETSQGVQSAPTTMVDDPYGHYEDRRARCPVIHITPNDAEALSAPGQFVQERSIYTCYGAEDVTQVIRDQDRFSTELYSTLVPWGRTIMDMSEPEHGVYRALVQPAFQQRRLAEWGPEVIEPIMHRLLDKVAPAGRADLVRDFTSKFPLEVITRLLGLPLAEEDHDHFRELTIAVISTYIDYDASVRAIAELREFMRPVVEARRVDPQDDVVSDLVHAEVDGKRLTDDEIFSFLLLLFPAGVDTTYFSSSNLFYALLTHPEQLDAVRNNLDLVPTAVEEALRWETGAPHGVWRVARDNTMVGDLKIEKGAIIFPNIASHNRDETRYDHADRFDIFRNESRPGLFGYGAHTCLGNHLARLELRTGLRLVLERLPGVRLDPDAPPPSVQGDVLRCAESLAVVFEAT